jgi:hypothetical protein
MSAGYTATGAPIASFPLLSRARSVNVGVVSDSVNNRRRAKHGSERLREISLDNEPSTDLFSVMASTITGSDINSRVRTSTTTTENQSTSNNTNESTTTSSKDTTEQEPADGTNNESSSSRKKSNTGSTTAKLDDLMKELVCV